MGAVKKMGSYNISVKAGMRHLPHDSITIEGWGVMDLTTSAASCIIPTYVATRLKAEHGSWLTLTQ